MQYSLDASTLSRRCFEADVDSLQAWMARSLFMKALKYFLYHLTSIRDPTVSIPTHRLHIRDDERPFRTTRIFPYYDFLDILLKA